MGAWSIQFPWHLRQTQIGCTCIQVAKGPQQRSHSARQGARQRAAGVTGGAARCAGGAAAAGGGGRIEQLARPRSIERYTARQKDAEEEQLKECTFAPQIRNRRSASARRAPHRRDLSVPGAQLSASRNLFIVSKGDPELVLNIRNCSVYVGIAGAAPIQPTPPLSLTTETRWSKGQAFKIQLASDLETPRFIRIAEQQHHENVFDHPRCACASLHSSADLHTPSMRNTTAQWRSPSVIAAHVSCQSGRGFALHCLSRATSIRSSIASRI